MRWRAAMAGAAAVALLACGNETSTAPPDRVAPFDALIYAEADLTLGKEQEDGLRALVKATTGKEPEGDPLMAALQALTRGRAGALTEVDDLSWLGDRIAYVSMAPLGDADHGVIATVRDADAGIDALADALEEKPRDVEVAGTDASHFKDADAYAAKVDDYLVVGGRNLVEDVVRTSGGGRSIRERQAYVRATKARASEPLATVYADLPRLSQTSDELAQTFRESFGERGVQEPYAYAIDLRGRVAIMDELVGGFSLPGFGANDLVAQAPANSWISVGANDLRTNGKRMLSGLASWTDLPELEPNALDEALASAGLELDRDVLGWMGDGAMWAAGGDEQTLRIGFVFEAAQPDGARDALRRLRRVLVSQGLPVKRVDDGLTLDFGDGTGVDVRLADGVMRLTYHGRRARDPRATILEGPRGEIFRSAIGEQTPALLVDTEELDDVARLLDLENDADWGAFEAFVKPFSVLGAVRGPKDVPRLVATIRE